MSSVQFSDLVFGGYFVAAYGAWRTPVFCAAVYFPFLPRSEKSDVKDNSDSVE